MFNNEIEKLFYLIKFLINSEEIKLLKHKIKNNKNGKKLVKLFCLFLNQKIDKVPNEDLIKHTLGVYKPLYVRRCLIELIENLEKHQRN